LSDFPTNQNNAWIPVLNKRKLTNQVNVVWGEAFDWPIRKNPQRELHKIRLGAHEQR